MNAEASCTGKRPFGTYKQASEAASKTAHGRGIKCRPYHCTKCGMFHYGQVDGHRTPRAQMKRRRQRNYETEE